MGKDFFLGRAERIIIAVVLALGAASFGLYYLIAAPNQTANTKDAPRTADSIIRSKDYVGPPSGTEARRVQKFDKRVILDLNSVDSVTLRRVPGIGPAFARRIIELRNRLGGYYTVLQLQEVYGMDEDKYLALRGWFAIRTRPTRYTLDGLRADELPLHPYLTRAHRQALNRHLYRNGKINTWRELMQTGAFSREDSIRLSQYFIEGRPLSSAQ